MKQDIRADVLEPTDDLPFGAELSGMKQNELTVATLCQANRPVQRLLRMIGPVERYRYRVGYDLPFDIRCASRRNPTP